MGTNTSTSKIRIKSKIKIKSKSKCKNMRNAWTEAATRARPILFPGAHTHRTIRMGHQ